MLYEGEHHVKNDDEIDESHKSQLKCCMYVIQAISKLVNIIVSHVSRTFANYQHKTTSVLSVLM